MLALLMALLGAPAGLLLDTWIAKLALEAYEHDAEEDDNPVTRGESAALVEANESIDEQPLPRALTTGAAQRRALVVALTAVLFGLAGWQYSGNAGHALIVVCYIAALVICAGTDLLAYRVPNVVTYPAIVFALVVGLVMPDASATNVTAGGLIGGGAFLAMCILTRGGMGMGDVKLAAFVGFALGLTLAVSALLVTAIVGGIIAVALLATGIRGRRDPIPYAPFISLGTLLVLLTQGAAFTRL